MDQFYVAPGVDGFFVDGSGTRYPVQRFGDDFIMQELEVDSMALVDTNQVTMMMMIMIMMLMMMMVVMMKIMDMVMMMMVMMMMMMIMVMI